MLTKSLFTIALVLPLVAMSATTQAGETITSKSFWPSEAKQSAQTRIEGAQRDWNSAFAYDRAGLSLEPATSPNEARSAWRYQGGPKSR